MEAHPLTAAQRVARLIEELGITPYEFGRQTGLSHQTISNVLTGKNRPSLDSLEAIAKRYPDTAVWLLTGKGQPRTGVLATPEPVRALIPYIAEEPAAAYRLSPAPAAEPALAERLMNELAECQKQNRLDLARAQKDFREDLIASSRTWQYTVDRMKETIDGQAAEITRLRTENTELRAYAGLDLPVTREREQPAPPAAPNTPIGFGRVLPSDAEALMALSYSNPSFIRPRVLEEEEVSHLQAA